MRNKTFALFALTALMLTLIVGVASAVTLSNWALTSSGSATSVDTRVTAGALADGSGVPFSGSVTFSVNGATANGFNSGVLNANDYYEVTLSPISGSNVVINSVSFEHMTNSVTPMSFDVAWSKDAFATAGNNLATGVASTTTSSTYSTPAGTNILLKSGETLTLRIFGYNAAADIDTFSIKNLNIKTTTPSDVVQCAVTHDALATNLKDNLVLDIRDVSVESGFGEDKEWFPFDTVSFEVRVDNDGTDEIENIELNWGLYNTETGDFIIDDEEPDFDLDNGDDETVAVEFKLDKDVDEFENGNWMLYAWANADDNEAVPNAVPTCASDSEPVEVVIEEDFVILENIKAPTEAQCLEEVTVTADVWNIGEDNQDDVYLEVYNKELGLNNQRIEVGDVDSFEDTPVEFTFNVPSGLSAKKYTIDFILYNDNDDVYENEYDDESAIFPVTLSVAGNCGAAAGSATVSATLESGGKAGEAMVVKTTVTNKGTKTATFTVNAAGYSTWASAASLSEDSFTLEAGKSKDVSITLQTKADAKGEQTLNVEVLSGSELVMTQPVSVMVQGSSAGFLSAITGNAVGDGKSLWIIGALNVLLVFAIIVIAIRFFLRR